MNEDVHITEVAMWKPTTMEEMINISKQVKKKNDKGLQEQVRTQGQVPKGNFKPAGTLQIGGRRFGYRGNTSKHLG